jgi:hypothetical protein
LRVFCYFKFGSKQRKRTEIIVMLKNISIFVLLKYIHIQQSYF